MDTDMIALTATAERAMVIVERKNRSRMVISTLAPHHSTESMARGEEALGL
jgi:hypothetical protein